MDYTEMYTHYIDNGMAPAEAMSLVDAEVQHDWLVSAQRVLEQLHNTEGMLILSIQDRPGPNALTAKLAETRRHISSVEYKIRCSQTE